MGKAITFSMGEVRGCIRAGRIVVRVGGRFGSLIPGRNPASEAVGMPHPLR